MKHVILGSQEIRNFENKRYISSYLSVVSSFLKLIYAKLKHSSHAGILLPFKLINEKFEQNTNQTTRSSEVTHKTQN